MKKIVILLITLLLISGCAKNEVFKLDEKYYGEGIVTNISSDELNKLVEDKESFAVFVYLSSCSSCTMFSPILTNFAKEYGINFYSISKEDAQNTTICECVKYSPSVTIYQEGEIVGFLDAASDKDLEYYESVDGFKKWFTKYVDINK